MKNMSQKKKSSAPSTNLNQSIGVDSRLHLLRSLSRARTAVLLALVGAMAAVAYSTTSASSGGGLLGSSASASKPVGGKAVSPIKRIVMRTQNLFGQAAGEPILGLADLNIERRGHTATQLAGGRILIVGGENAGGLVKKSEVFDPGSRSFLIAAKLRTSRKDHTATKLEDGRVLVAGGRDQDLIDSTEIFDLAKGEFVSGPPLNQARAGHSATTLKDGRILIAGGDDHGTAEIFDPETQTFTLLEGRLSASRAFHSAVLLRNGKVLIAGGMAEDKSAIQHGEVFDPESMSFSVTRNSMRGARLRPTLRVLPDGKVQVIGGDPERSMEMFNAEGEYFTAYAHLLPGSNPISQVLRAQTRAGLICEVPPGDLKLQAALPAWLDELLDRSEHSLIDMPSSGEAVVAGGKSGSGKVLKSVVILSSSGATVTTDKTDYVPGETVIMTGSSWAVGETVQLTLHRDVGADDTILTSVADADGNFTNSEYVIQDSDLNVTFLLTAAGQTSGYAAQTAFTDAGPTNPTAQSLPYSQDFSGLPHSGAGSGIYPAGWQGWTLANGSSASFRTSAPTADENLIAGSSASTTQGGVLNYNGKVGILATGSGGTDPSLCLAVDTTGGSGVVVGFDIMTIRNPHNGTTNTRINQVDLQYRVGTTGLFTSVSGNANGIYQNNSTTQTASGVTTPQNLEAKIFTLPAACDSQPNVQLRWVQRDTSALGGSRPSFAVDNLSVGVCPSVGATGAITGPTSVCAGATGVTYSISAVGGATAYTWTVPSGASIASGQGTTSITLNWGSTSGDVTVTPSNSCATGSASSLAMTVSAASVGGNASASDSPICSGSSTTISLSGQTGSIVKWQSSTDGGATWSDIVSTANPLPTGALSVTTQFRAVVKSGSCLEANSSAATVTVDTVSFTTSKTDVTCNGANNGAITVTTTSGTAPFMFSKDNGGSFQSSNVFSGLSAGTYNVVVKDANNCTAASQSVTITEPAALVLSEIHTNVSCNGGSNSSIDLNVSGGTPGYSYSWSPGGATSQDLSGLSPGTYTVTVTDVNGCTASTSITITQPAAPLALSETHTNISCNGRSNGSIDLSVSGGTPGYSYSWSPGGAPTQDLSGLSAGAYTVTVTDANGCTASTSVSITQPAAPLALSETHTNVSCNGGSKGSIDLSVGGGTPGYSYSWSPGGATTQDLSGLSAGTYTVTVTDANGCTAMKGVTITEPTALVLSERHTNVSCFGGSNGSIDLSVSGGTPGYSYSWSPGGATSQDLSGLSPGTYTVTVTDANGCTAMKGVTITQPSLLTCSVIPASAVICAGGLQTFTASPSGGTPNYTYLWNTGATTQSITVGVAGSYSVTVADANGCTTSCSATLVVTSATVTVTPNTQQYSEKATFVATLSPVGILPAGSIVTFCVGTQDVGTATLAINGSVLKATLFDVPLLEPTPYGTAPTGQMAPGTHTVTAKFGAAAVPICDPTTSLTITREDARAYYTGAVFSSTACATCSTATVTLSATIKDITAETSDPATDPCPGDIRNATVTFIDRDTNTAIISNLPVGLVSPGDAKIGTATYNWSVNIGAADSQNFTIGIIVNNYYTRDNSADDTVVTVSKPLNNFTTGGGYLVMSSSSGLYPGEPGSKCNWGFNVKYNNSGKNLQGNMNVIIRNGGRVYQIKGNAMTSLSVNAATGKATFNGKANIQDITDPLSVTAIDGNATLQVVMTDKGEPGSQDTIGITVWNKQGGLWFSSHWNGTTTVEQLLGGGNLVVH